MKKKAALHKEDPSINFRLPAELKEQIYSEAEYNNQTVSNYLREHMQEFLSGELYENAIFIYKRQTFVNTPGFIKLIVYMNSKLRFNRCTENNYQLDVLIKILKQLDGTFPPPLQFEFDKVLMDVLKMRSSDVAFRKINFTKDYITNSDVGFNFDLLEKYMVDHVKTDDEISEMSI